MKKNDIILLVSVLIYSYLFYNQTPGINFLLFTVLLITCQLITDASIVKNRLWIISTIGCLLSGVAILIWGNTIAVAANIISLSMASVYTVNRQSSLLFALFYSVYSYLSSLLHSIVEYVIREKAETSSNQPVYTKFLITIVPVLVASLFFILYREGSPLFKQATSAVNFDFLSFEWISFTLLGLILLYGFYKPRNILLLNVLDISLADRLYNNYENNNQGFFSYVNENLSGTIMLLLLNTLLLLVNILDLQFLFVSHKLPDGLNYTEFVHQGVYTLIVSIVIAIAVILYYLRGGLNFYENNQWLLRLAYIWILQNMLLVFSTVFKNQLYINEYGLTYKRIGVYIYLLLTLIGLVFTIVKIVKVKSNWFLFRKNSWAFYFVLIVSCFFNWDLIITRYNIKYTKNFDKGYALELGESVLPDLIAYHNQQPHNPNVFYPDYEIVLKNRREKFLSDYSNEGWQSWNLEKNRIFNSIK